MGYLRVPPYDAKAVANYFLDLAKRDGKTIDPMKIQKLVYLAHGWSLALLNKPLITDKIEAWKYGPVIRSLYGAFRDAGNGPILHPAFEAKVENGKVVFATPKLDDIEQLENEDVRNLLDEVWKVYRDYTAIQLSNYTHQHGSPWECTWKPDEDGLVINDDVIKAYFHRLAIPNEALR